MLKHIDFEIFTVQEAFLHYAVYGKSQSRIFLKMDVYYEQLKYSLTPQWDITRE